MTVSWRAQLVSHVGHHCRGAGARYAPGRGHLIEAGGHLADFVLRRNGYALRQVALVMA